MTTHFATHFETKPRPDSSVRAGELFTTLKDDAPPWLKEAVREAHQGDLPLDWVYAECRTAAEAVDAGDLDLADENAVHEYVDSRVDVYTRELFQWAADHCLTATWAAAEEAAHELELPKGFAEQIAAVQYAAIHFVTETVRQACARAVCEQAAS